MAGKMIIKIVKGQWYATLDGKHLTAQQTAKLIAKGTPYKIIGRNNKAKTALR